jgi:hypothetical protein
MMMDKDTEAFYDSEIAPELAYLAKRCTDRGMSFVAAVEYAPGNHAGTYMMVEGACLQMEMIRMCSKTAPNIDSYLINLIRFCKENKIDFSGGLFLRDYSS